MQNSYAVTQGTIRANAVGSAQVDHRRLRVAETETLERTRAAINSNTSLAPEEKEIAQLQLNALACSAVKCANGVSKDDPLYGQLLALQSAGETLNQQGTSLDSILGEEAGGQFEHGLKTRFDDLLTSQDEMVVRAAGAGQAAAGALGMVGGVAMGAASAAGCVPSAGLSCAGVVAGSAITVLSLEQGRVGLDTAFGAYHHTEGQAVSNSFATETHQGEHNPSLDLAIDVGIAATELVAAKLGTKYLEKALDGKVVKSEVGGTGKAGGGAGAESNLESKVDQPTQTIPNRLDDFQHGSVTGHYDATNVGPLGNNVDDLAGTFSGGKYTEIVLDKDVVLYRAGSSDRPLGQFFTQQPPESVIKTRIDSAVLPTWPNGAASPIDSQFSVRIPAGTKVYIGEVSTQGGHFVGGTQQIVVPKPWLIDGVEVLESAPLN